MTSDLNVWAEAARELRQRLGYLEARRKTIEWRDSSSPGTATYAFHNATLKALERQEHECTA